MENWSLNIATWRPLVSLMGAVLSEGYNWWGSRKGKRDLKTSIYITGASLVAQLVKNPLAMQETPVRFLGQEDLMERDRLPTPVFLGFPGGSDSKVSACSVGDLGLIPGLGRSPGGRHGNPHQHSFLENPHGQRSLEGYSTCDGKELAITERLSTPPPPHIYIIIDCPFEKFCYTGGHRK